MPIVPGLLERLAMLKLNKGPGPFLDILGGFSFYAVYTAVRLDLFERLAGSPRSAEELAERIGCDERGLGILLEALETLGYVRRRDGAYALSEMSEAWMLEASPTCFARAFSYYGDSMADFWPRLHQVLRTGAPEINFYDWLRDHPEDGEQYQQFMMSLARMGLTEWRKKVRLPDGARRLIDVGGGHGLYSIALCQRYPDLRAAIFDSAYARDLAGKNIDEAGLGDRIEFVECDYLRDDLGSGFDAALLSNVVHEHTDRENGEIVARVAGALSEGGWVIVNDIVRENKLTALQDHIARMFGLMFYLFLGSQNFTFGQISGWLRSAGFNKISRKNLRSGANIVIGAR
jgi:predicted O-methyltransferase YrrM